MLQQSSFSNLVRLVLDLDESADDVSLESLEGSEVELDADAVSSTDDSDLSSSDDVALASSLASASDVVGYDDAAVLDAISGVDARLQEVNSNLTVLQSQQAYGLGMGMWTLVVCAGFLITYIFYSIAKKFV